MKIVEKNMLKNMEINVNDIGNLWHGTDEKYIDSISYNGFDVTRNKTSAYGIGTYVIYFSFV